MCVCSAQVCCRDTPTRRDAQSAAMGFGCFHLLALAPALALGSSPADADAVCSKHACSTDINATRTFRRWPEPNIVPWSHDLCVRSLHYAQWGDCHCRGGTERFARAPARG